MYQNYLLTFIIFTTQVCGMSLKQIDFNSLKLHPVNVVLSSPTNFVSLNKYI
jgi:hypothetical protein